MLKLFLIIMSVTIGVHLTIHRQSCKAFASFAITLDGMVDSGSILRSLNSQSRIGCVMKCVSLAACKSVNFKSADGQCQLLERGFSGKVTSLTKKEGWTYMTTDEEYPETGPICKQINPCHKGRCRDTCNSQGFECICDKYYYGTRCDNHQPIQDCTSVYNSGNTTDGVYSIYVSKPGISMNVFCDMTANHVGWIVIQRRIDASVDFYRDWQSYKNGFGNISGNMWMGLDKIHQLAGPGRRAMIRFDLKHRSNPTKLYYAEYTTFEVRSEAEKYKLLIGGYSGDAGDSMKHHNGMKFTTYDNDNDMKWIRNCAKENAGGWWYNACHMVNLNGLYPTASNNHQIYMSWSGLGYNGIFGNVIHSEIKIKYP